MKFKFYPNSDIASRNVYLMIPSNSRLYDYNGVNCNGVEKILLIYYDSLKRNVVNCDIELFDSEINYIHRDIHNSIFVLSNGVIYCRYIFQSEKNKFVRLPSDNKIVKVSYCLHDIYLLLDDVGELWTLNINTGDLSKKYNIKANDIYLKLILSNNKLYRLDNDDNLQYVPITQTVDKIKLFENSPYDINYVFIDLTGKLYLLDITTNVVENISPDSSVVIMEFIAMKNHIIVLDIYGYLYIRYGYLWSRISTTIGDIINIHYDNNFFVETDDQLYCCYILIDKFNRIKIQSQIEFDKYKFCQRKSARKV